MKYIAYMSEIYRFLNSYNRLREARELPRDKKQDNELILNHVKFFRDHYKPDSFNHAHVMQAISDGLGLTKFVLIEAVKIESKRVPGLESGEVSWKPNR